MTPEEAVRAYFSAYSEGHPERFDEMVSQDYLDYGHTPPGRGPQGARADYEQAVRRAGGSITYDIDAMLARNGAVAVAWTGHLPNGSEYSGLSLYQVVDGLVDEARHAMIVAPPL
jgi:hypothetical protein